MLQLIGGLQALGQIESHNDLAQLFTFTTEPEDIVVAELTEQLISAAQDKLTDATSASQINYLGYNVPK